MKKTCFIVAGPNGAGKSSFAEWFLPNEAKCFYFVNADMIAKGISPLRPENARVEAGKILFRKIEEYSNKGVTFAFESTLSGTGYLKRIGKLKEKGYRIVIYYLQLISEDLAVERVKCRVKEGGHAIPEPDIRRRFNRSRQNFSTLYQGLADEWIVFDNSGDEPIILKRSS